MLARHPNEFFTVNNKPAWGLVIDNLDFKIVHSVRYERARKANFHHVYYLPEFVHEKIRNQEVTFLWADDKGISAFEPVAFQITDEVKKYYEKAL